MNLLARTTVTASRTATIAVFNLAVVGIVFAFFTLTAEARDSTFWKSCRNYSIRGHWMTAECLGNDQRYYATELTLLGIENDDGELEFKEIFDISNGGRRIATFEKSCNEIKLDEVLGYILTANCRRNDGSSNGNRIELTDIENHDGALRYYGTDDERDPSVGPVPVAQAAAPDADRTDDGFCKQYASEAVAQNFANLASKCGLSDLRWQSNFQNHYDWCIQQTVAAAQGEYDARAKIIITCKNAQGAAAGSNPPGTTACLFFDANFLGTSKCMPAAGKFNVKAERANEYSSARVSSGYRMIIYTGRDQTGTKCGFLRGDIPQIPTRCDNKTQSIDIQKEE